PNCLSVWAPGLIVSLAAALILGLAALAVLTAMALATALVARQARRSLGGQTGDVLGAVQLTAETAGWVVLAATL
ncbi:unnamed protein product, partial [Chrysoparadoxa australica]